MEANPRKKNPKLHKLIVHEKWQARISMIARFCILFTSCIKQIKGIFNNLGSSLRKTAYVQISRSPFQAK